MVFKKFKFIIAGLGFFLFLFSFSLFNQSLEVIRVIDGDTIELSDGRVVRYVGIKNILVRNRHMSEEIWGVVYSRI